MNKPREDNEKNNSNKKSLLDSHNQHNEKRNDRKFKLPEPETVWKQKPS